ncbi:C6 transcription factor [Echria macrotheca]|uniref:C6 transcription factor n=1 Tax=Echria macrotheca TaxID=438768 RepID=A0AAJ0F0R1_9PEZI|nr:C6 transcription factor [Echria macrotheca]
MPRAVDSEFVPASYGQACVHCVRSKTSCRRRIEGGPCERCLRRGKECQQAPGGRREIGKRAGSRTTRLEEKLDSLVTLLQTSAASGGGPSILQPGAPAASTSAPAAVDASDVRAQAGFAPPGPSSQHFPPTPSASSHQYSVPTPQSYTPGSDPENVSEDEAEECLLRFQTEQLKCFPFIYIPPTMSAVELQTERPFLWLCILAVSTKSAARQVALGAKIRQMVATRLIVEHERSVETLLGLLAFMGWANYQLGPSQPFLSMYCHLITGLTQDLGLDRLPRKADEPMHPMACLKSHHTLAMKLAAHAVRTMEERRAVIAAFIITSEVSAFRAFCFNRTVDGLRWNSSMDEYLKDLEERQEAPLDKVLVTLAKLKLIGDEALRPYSLPSRPTDQLGFLQVFQVKTLQASVNQIREKLPAGLETEGSVLLHFLEIELQIHEIGLYTVPPRGKTTHAPDSQRLAMLARCVQAARSWFDCFFSLPPASYAHYSFSLWVQLCHAITSVYRLSLLEEPGWDTSLVRDSLDLMQLMDMLVERLKRTAEEAGLEVDRANAFTNVINSIRTIRNAWEPMLRRQTADVVVQGEAAAPAFQVPPMDSFSAEFLDGVNGWMSDMMFSWDGIS